MFISNKRADSADTGDALKPANYAKMPPLSTRHERVSSFLAPLFCPLEFGVLPGSQPEEI